MARLAFSVLGGLGAQIDSEPVELGTRKQRSVLAQLLLADGSPVSVGSLVDGVWGEHPPDRAEASLQAYVSGLRKALEPDRQPRTPATVLVTRGAGYALLIDDDRLDLRRLLRDIAQAHDAHRHGRSEASARLLSSVLARYRPLLPEFEGHGFRDLAATHLERRIGEAQEFSFEVRLALGEHRTLVTELEQAVHRSPLDEGLWVLLATARYRLGRQSDALAAIAEVRQILAEQIGVDPGPRLRALERDILDHAPSLDIAGDVVARSAAAVTAPQPGPAALDTGATEPGNETVVDTSERLLVRSDTADARPPDSSRHRTPAADPETAGREDPSSAPAHRHALVGRTDELAVLHRAVLTSLHGPGGFVIVEGEPGAGKTALLEEAVFRAAAASDLRVLWGRCLDDAAAPSMWPWVQILGAVLPEIASDQRERMLNSDLGRMVTQGTTVIPPPRAMPDATARFHFYDQAADLLEGVAESRLLIIVLDDLQWADSASLELLAHMASRRVGGVTFFASMRSAPAQRTVVANTLAALARLPQHRRIELGPLTDDDISEVVRRETHDWPTAETVSSIARRTGGNAFFVLEIARILAGRGGVEAGGVPSGVRDVVRERLRPLPDATRELLDVAALVGSRVDMSLLAAAAARPVDDSLDALEFASGIGLIVLDPEDPFTFGFSHDLIRESIADGIGPTHARRIHLAIADQLEHRRSDIAVAQRASHLWAAGPLADRARTAQALLDAGRIALRSYSFDTAERLLRNSAALAAEIGIADTELEAITTWLTSDVSRNGYLAADPELLRRARELGQALDDISLLARLDYAQFAAYSQSADISIAHRYARRLHRRALESAQTATDNSVLYHVGIQAAAIDALDRGEFGEAYRLLDADDVLDGPPVDGILTDQMMFARGFHALAATVHVGPSLGRRLFEQLDVGPDDPIAHLGAAIFCAVAAGLAGHTAWARTVCTRLLTAPEHGTLEYLRTGGERIYWWARALDGDTDEALERIDELASRPRRTGYGLWLALRAEVLIAAGRLDGVPTVLDEAREFADRSGQTYPEAHRLLVLAKFRHAAGHSARTVTDALHEARQHAARQEAALLVDRVDAFAAEQGYGDVTS